MTDLPGHWDTRALGDIADIRPGRTPRALDRYLSNNPRPHRTVPFFKVGDMNAHPSDLRVARTYLAQEELASLGVSVLPIDSIVFPKAGGAIATNKKRRIAIAGAVDLNCMGVVPGAGVDARYLRAWFESLDLTSLADGSVLPQISKKTVSGLSIPLPDLAEQRRIVDILEDHLSRLDAAAGSIARARTGLGDLLALAAEAAYRGTSFADAGVSHSVPELPSSNKLGRRITEPAYSPPFKLAEGRRWCSVDAAATLVTDGDHNPPRRVPNGIPHVTAKGIRNGQIVLDGCTYVSEEGFEQTSRRYAALPGDVLVTCVGTIGRIAVVPDGIRFSADRNLAAVRPHSSFVSSEFLALCLNSVSLQQRMRHVSGSTAQPHLYLKDLRGLPLAVPDEATQVKVVGAARDLRSGVMRQLNEIAWQEKRAYLLRRSLMSAAFSGQLTGRSSDFEAAEERSVSAV